MAQVKKSRRSNLTAAARQKHKNTCEKSDLVETDVERFLRLRRRSMVSGGAYERSVGGHAGWRDPGLEHGFEPCSSGLLV